MFQMQAILFSNSDNNGTDMTHFLTYCVVYSPDQDFFTFFSSTAKSYNVSHYSKQGY